MSELEETHSDHAKHVVSLVSAHLVGLGIPNAVAVNLNDLLLEEGSSKHEHQLGTDGPVPST